MITEKEVDKIVSSGKSSYTLNPENYDIVNAALIKAMAAYKIENPGFARFWPIIKKKENGLYVTNDIDKSNESFYQSKRAKLKKQVTHWMGKFSIVKQENNRLREINKALGKRTKHLREYITQKEIRAITQVGDNTLRELKMPAPFKGIGKPVQC